jgi:hypothetical protein
MIAPTAATTAKPGQISAQTRSSRINERSASIRSVTGLIVAAISIGSVSRSRGTKFGTVVPRRVDPAELLLDREPAGGIEAGGRLVEEEDLRLVHECRREVEPAVHAARVALDHAVGGVLELDQLQQLLGPLLARAR